MLLLKNFKKARVWSTDYFLFSSPAWFLWKHRWSLKDFRRLNFCSINQGASPTEVDMLHKLPLLERLTWHVHMVHCPRGSSFYTLLERLQANWILIWCGKIYIYCCASITFLLSKYIRKGLNHLHRSYIGLDHSTDGITVIPRWNVVDMLKTLVSTHPPERLEMNTSDLSMVFVKPNICQVAVTFKVTHKWLDLYFCSVC